MAPRREEVDHEALKSGELLQYRCPQLNLVPVVLLDEAVTTIEHSQDVPAGEATEGAVPDEDLDWIGFERKLEQASGTPL